MLSWCSFRLKLFELGQGEYPYPAGVKLLRQRGKLEEVGDVVHHKGIQPVLCCCSYGRGIPFLIFYNRGECTVESIQGTGLSQLLYFGHVELLTQKPLGKLSSRCILCNSLEGFVQYGFCLRNLLREPFPRFLNC